jgi:hypothetical protein
LGGSARDKPFATIETVEARDRNDEPDDQEDAPALSDAA